MNKSELVASVAEKTGCTKKDTEAVISAALDTIVETVAKKEKALLVGFGTFEIKERAERIGRNPRTNEAIPVPASVDVKFKAGKDFKDAIAQK